MAGVFYFVIPCYNEEEALPETSVKIIEKLKNLIDSGMISDQSRAMFVDDGSADKTWDFISELCDSTEFASGVKLSRNYGHQNALMAGLMTARIKADMTVSIDADLQDDLNVVDDMISKYDEGCDIVLGVRKSRGTDTFAKRTTARGYYKLLSGLGCDIVEDHADFRLMSRRAMDELSKFEEYEPFLRGIVPMIGLKTDKVYYDRFERTAGETKYPLKKMLALAFNGITSLSIKPIRLILGFGIIMLAIAAALLIFSIVQLCFGYTMLNWKIITISVWAVGGFVVSAIGIIGEYIGRAYIETKKRPRYIIENVKEK